MNKVVKPTLLIDSVKVSNNIKRMVQKVRSSGAVLWPHFKTHQSVEVGEIFRNHGIDKITVSSVDMASRFADAGWHDITIAFPVNLREIDEINRLASIINLNLLAESLYSLQFLENRLTHKTGLFIKIDTGYHRTGLLPENPEIEKMIRFLENSKKMELKGFLTHAGHTYHAKGKKEILSIMESARQQLNRLKQKYIGRFPDLMVSYGDTPSCSMAATCNGFDEIRPGNFVYYDVMQYHIGSCRLEDIAVAVACPVVAIHPERGELVMCGGAVHLSKEAIKADNGFTMYGYVTKLSESGWGAPIPGAYISSLSQEHGIVKIPGKYLEKFKPGDIIGVLPVHSCLTADLLEQQLLLNVKG